jgi:hypothetical protein
MTTNHQSEALWVPQPLEWGPSKHYDPNSEGARTTTVEREATHVENPDDN